MYYSGPVEGEELGGGGDKKHLKINLKKKKN